MKKNFWQKKGVSPLIATVLLISFAVALGAVVMNWGRSIDIIGPDDKCAGVGITVRKTNYEVCFGGSGSDAYVNFIIDNTGSMDISGLGIWIVGTKGTKFHDLDSLKISKGALLDIKDESTQYDFNEYGNIKHVQFIPKILIEGSLEICPKNTIKADKIDVCG
jgi:flagellin-like protein